MILRRRRGSSRRFAGLGQDALGISTGGFPSGSIESPPAAITTGPQPPTGWLGTGPDIFGISTGGFLTPTPPTAPIATPIATLPASSFSDLFNLDIAPSVSLPAAPSPSVSATPAPIALLPPSLSVAAPGLSPSDLLPPAGSISVTSEGNIINENGQILGIVDKSGKVSAEPTSTPPIAPGTVLAAGGLATNIAAAVSRFFGTPAVTGNNPTVSGWMQQQSIAGVPNSMLAVGAGALLLVALAGAGRRR